MGWGGRARECQGLGILINKIHGRDRNRERRRRGAARDRSEASGVGRTLRVRRIAERLQAESEQRRAVDAGGDRRETGNRKAGAHAGEPAKAAGLRGRAGQQEDPGDPAQDGADAAREGAAAERPRAQAGDEEDAAEPHDGQPPQVRRGEGPPHLLHQRGARGNTHAQQCRGGAHSRS